MRHFNILTIPGSLRASSSSNIILKNISLMFPPEANLQHYEGIATLPHFNDSDHAPDSVIQFRAMLKEADAVLICQPEYAFGVAGSLKNAIDWTVGSGEFVDKPVILVTAASNGEKAHAAMILILNALSAKLQENTLLIPFVKTKINTNGSIIDSRVKEQLQLLVDNFMIQLKL
jgi:chromate reductase